MNAIKKNITVMLIDDELSSINILELYLSTIENIEIVQKITDPKIIYRMFKRTCPDIIFLDIDMKDYNGLEIAKIIKQESPDTEIIFATGHPEYAFNALEVKPLSYLVKPFNGDSIKDIIARYREKLDKQEMEEYLGTLIGERMGCKKMKLTIKGGFILVDPNDIMLCKAEESFCRIYLKDGESEVIKMSVQQFLKAVDFLSFFKANKSNYINIQYLIKIERKKKVCTVGYGNNKHTIDILSTNLINFEKTIISLSDDDEVE